jgi:hypothetical protein
MKILYSAILILITSLSLMSCQREVHESLPVPNSGDSLITRVIEFDTSYISGLDTSFVYAFNYDASERLLRLNSIFYKPGVTGSSRIKDEEELIYHYNGSEIYPFKITAKYVSYDIPDLYYDTCHLTYTEGYVSRDSTGLGGNYSVASFTKLGANRFFLQRKSFMYTDTTYVNIQLQGSNIIKEVDSLKQPGGWTVTTTVITYDNKPNPFKAISIPYPAPFHYYLPEMVPQNFARQSANNITSIVDGNGTLVLNYEYGPTGLPKILRGVGSTFKYLYYYTSL